MLRPSGGTGVQTHFNQLRRHLARRRVAHDLVTPFSRLKILSYPIFAVRRIIDPFNGRLSVWWYNRFHYLFLKVALQRLLADGKPIVVYAQCPFSAVAALRCRRGKSQRVVMAAHFNGSFADEWIGKGKIEAGDWVHTGIVAVEREALAHVDGLVFDSQYIRRCILGNVPQASTVSSITLPNFVEAPVADSRPARSGDLISIGTLEPRKNQQFLLQVLAAAKQKGHSYTLTLVGDGPDRSMLESLAGTLGVAGQVTFAGFVPDAWRLMPGFRAYAHGAKLENFPLVLVHAMSYGLPMLAAPVGGIPEAFEDGIEGRFWALDDPAGGAEKLIALLEDEPGRAAMARAAKLRYGERYETDAVARRLTRFLLSGQTTP